MKLSSSSFAFPKCFAPFARHSQHAQQPMECVTRWNAFRDNGLPLRKQTVLQHAYSFDVFMATACTILRANGVTLDYQLLQTAATFHDLGEGLLGRDINRKQKGPEHDVQEYEAFCDTLYLFDDVVQRALQRVFLLQFARAEPNELFDDEAQEILQNLWKHNFREACYFQALEALEYIMFPLENMMGQVTPCPKTLVWVLRAQVSRLNGLLTVIPRLRHVWTEDMALWCQSFLEKHSHVPDQPF